MRNKHMTFVEPLQAELLPIKYSAALDKKESTETSAFLKTYDEVLNTRVLHVFRKSGEEQQRAHDHRALKIIGGERVNLRLDTLNGQADGIKVSLDKEVAPLYIWFHPDRKKKEIIFKTVCGEQRKRLHFKPEQIGRDFLVGLISSFFFL